MKKRIKEICGILAGLILLVAYILTGTYGLSPKDKELYNDALALQKIADAIGFVGFRLEDYPVAFYDGKNEYVIESDGSVEKRDPILSVMVATAYPVGDHMEVIVPTYKNLLAIVGLGNPAAGAGEGGEARQWAYCISTIWHEALHAWQLTYHWEGIALWKTGDDFEGSGVDQNTEVRALYQQQLALLMQGALETDHKKLEAVAIAVCDLEDKIKEKLSDELYNLSAQTELTEGSAQYFESMIFRALCGEEAYVDHYIEGMDIYREGRNKYYTLGSGKCLLLDKLNPAWKNNFVMDRSFAKMLREALQ